MGGHCIVDPTPEEEACSAAAVVMAVTPDGRVTTFKKMGSGSFHQQTLATAVELGKKANTKEASTCPDLACCVLVFDLAKGAPFHLG